MNLCEPEYWEGEECDRIPARSPQVGCTALRPRPSRRYRRYAVELPTMSVAQTQKRKRGPVSIPWEDVIPTQYAETGELYCPEKDEVIASELGVAACAVANARKRRGIRSHQWHLRSGR